MKKPINFCRLTSNTQMILVTMIFILGFFQHSFAQEAEIKEEVRPYVEIKLLDGSNITGKLIEETDEYILINNTSLGETKVIKSKIDSYKILPADSFTNGVYYHPTVNSSRNIFSPTGYGLKKGEGYYQNFLLFVNQISYGVTDNFSIGAGFEIASLLEQIGNSSEGDGDKMRLPAFMITPKFSIPSEGNHWNVGIGGVALSIPDTDNLFDLGLLYGVSTWGDENNNITLGIGISATEEGISKRPMFTLSGTGRISKRMAFVTENWLVSSEDYKVVFVSAGARYLGSRISVDFALMGAGSKDGFFVSPIPLVGITIPFGKGWGK